MQVAVFEWYVVGILNERNSLPPFIEGRFGTAGNSGYCEYGYSCTEWLYEFALAIIKWKLTKLFSRIDLNWHYIHEVTHMRYCTVKISFSTFGWLFDSRRTQTCFCTAIRHVKNWFEAGHRILWSVHDIRVALVLNILLHGIFRVLSLLGFCAVCW